MATNDELRAAVYLLKQAAMEELPEAEVVEICTATVEDAVAFRWNNVTAVIMPMVETGGAK